VTHYSTYPNETLHDYRFSLWVGQYVCENARYASSSSSGRRRASGHTHVIQQELNEASRLHSILYLKKKEKDERKRIRSPSDEDPERRCSVLIHWFEVSQRSPALTQGARYTANNAMGMVCNSASKPVLLIIQYMKLRSILTFREEKNYWTLQMCGYLVGQALETFIAQFL
jgi:hypothetical protein